MGLSSGLLDVARSIAVYVTCDTLNFRSQVPSSRGTLPGDASVDLFDEDVSAEADLVAGVRLADGHCEVKPGRTITDEEVCVGVATGREESRRQPS
jgi:hypothetical protein